MMNIYQFNEEIILDKSRYFTYNFNEYSSVNRNISLKNKIYTNIIKGHEQIIFDTNILLDKTLAL